jgi:luciferase-type oxidoreductase
LSIQAGAYSVNIRFMVIASKTGGAAEAAGFRRMFAPGRLTLGVFFPIESYEGDQPQMKHQEARAQRAEALGYTALWFRDVPLRDPHFGDVGQVYDPWVYMGWIAAHTREIALATGSIVLPLRHPVHTAKAAASLERLTNGRLVMGVASGDRPVEFPAFNVPYEKRGELFRENFGVVRTVLVQSFPRIDSSYGGLAGTADLVPKPAAWLPMLVTGYSRQNLDWIAENADGWITYPRPFAQQAEIAARWRSAVAAAAQSAFKPLAQSLYVDLTHGADQQPSPIHLGFRSGRKFLLRFLEALRHAGINHVILNFKYSKRDAGELLEEIGTEILPRLESGQAARSPPEGAHA